MKYAVIALSGCQYRVEEGKTYTLDLQEAKEGDTKTTDQVLLIVDDKETNIGTPTVKNASVEYQVIKNYQGEKLRVFKYKSKSRYRKTKGFRAQLSEVKILKINL